MGNGMKSVLVIDDEEIVRTCCVRSLKPLGYEVSAAADGVEGLKAFKDRGGYDVAIVDLKMPNMDSRELIAQIKLIKPDCRILIVTGYFTAEAQDAVASMGASGYLEKPFCPGGLMEAIKKL